MIIIFWQPTYGCTQKLLKLYMEISDVIIQEFLFNSPPSMRTQAWNASGISNDFYDPFADIASDIVDRYSWF